MYAAFGRGDIPAILEHLADNVDWEYGYRVAPNPVPWLQPREDKGGVAKFFESLGALEFHRFTPKVFLEGTGLVVALIDLEVTVKATGKRIVESDEAHIWHFNEVGQVVRFRHCVDTYQHVLAYSG
jgi:ketosteroid isomerase-like protein